jgi:hypothetical protein
MTRASVRVLDFTECNTDPVVDAIARALKRRAKIHALRERLAQGLPPTITNPAVIDRLAAMLRPGVTT